MCKKPSDSENFSPQNIAPEMRDETKKKNGRKWVIISCIVFILVYSIFWYFMANFVQNKVELYITKAATNNIDIRCEKLSKAGYPLRVALSCSNFAVNFAERELDHPDNILTIDSLLTNNTKSQKQKDFANTSDKDKKYPLAQIGNQAADIALGGRGIKAGAPIYAPHWILIDIKDPAWLKPPHGEIIPMNWKKLQLSGNFASAKERDVNLAAEMFTLSNLPFWQEDKAIFVDFFRFDSKEQENNKAAITLAFDNLFVPYNLSGKSKSIPLIDGFLDVRLDNAKSFYQAFTQYIQTSNSENFRGQSGNLKQVSLSFEKGGGFTLSGPVSVAESGKINGNVTVSVNDSNALMRTIRSVFPAQVMNLRSLFFVINSMPKNDKGEPQLQLQIQDGRLRMGFLKLGKLPTL